mgnify:CR=1 FL=1
MEVWGLGGLGSGSLYDYLTPCLRQPHNELDPFAFIVCVAFTAPTIARDEPDFWSGNRREDVFFSDEDRRAGVNVRCADTDTVFNPFPPFA